MYAFLHSYGVHLTLTFTVLATFAMKQMSSVPEGGKSIRTLVPDALHFQRGVQNVRVRDLEVETPVLLISPARPAPVLMLD